MNRSLFPTAAVVVGLCFSAAALRAADSTAPEVALESGQVGQDGRYCSATVFTQFLACRSEIVDDLYTTQAFCTNISNDDERRECFVEATAGYRDDLAACRMQHSARKELCDALGEERYEPDFDPQNFDADFANPINPNPYFPLAIGNQWSYRNESETFTDEVLDETKLIEGVTCLVLRNSAYADGKLIELTDDWYGRRTNGDIIYCGEQVKNYESFDGDEPAGPELLNLDGSFKVGRQARPGLLFPRFPSVGQVYRQEWAPGDAEDVAEVVSLSYGFGSLPAIDGHAPQALAKMLCANDCVVTRDYTPISPGTVAYKVYAKGIGFAFEVEFLEDGEVEVVEIVGCNFDARCEALPGAEREE